MQRQELLKVIADVKVRLGVGKLDIERASKPKLLDLIRNNRLLDVFSDQIVLKNKWNRLTMEL